MRHAAWRLSILLVAPLCAQSGNEESAPPITVYTQFEHSQSADSFAEMQHELASIMAPVGLHFEWRSLEGARGNEVAVELVVVTFKGECGAGEPLPMRSQTGPLGWTHMSDGDVLPFSDVDCDRIRRFIAPQLTALNHADQQRVFGRAMGRVLAHELYHVFMHSTRHASWGVAKAFYTAQELVSDTFAFQQKESKALRDGKFKSLLRSRPSSNTLTGTGH